MTSEVNSEQRSPSLPQEMDGTPAQADTHTYAQIVRSSTLIGGASVLSIALGIVRTKAMATLLGPSGVGLLGVYGAIADLARSVAAMGINGSGVRQIAEACASGDNEKIARTVTVLRRIALALAVVGGVVLVILSPLVSNVTFGNEGHAGAVALLSLAVGFRLIADGQAALVQGMRRISDLARMGVLGALLGTIVSVVLVYCLGEQGVVPSLVAVAGMSIATSWWYSRKVGVPVVAMPLGHAKREAAALLKLGLAFMMSGFLTMGAAYAVRAMVLSAEGMEAAGLYHAAWMLGGLYVGIVLQAMGTDFYPRLVAVVNDNRQCNRLVNEQAQVSLLLAGPGTLATLTFAPLVIVLFYSARFGQAVDLLRWVCLGVALRVITWPMGFIVVAKNRRAIFLGAELAWTVVNISLTWLCLQRFGLNGAGIAFFGSYVFHGLMIYPIARHLSGFTWSTANRSIGALFVCSIAIVFCSFYVLPPVLAMTAGTLATILSGLYALRALVNLVSRDRIPRPILYLLDMGRFTR